MAAAFTLDSHINIVCLPPVDFVPNQQDCFANGWGKNAFELNGESRVILKKISLGIVEFGRCQQHLQATRLGTNFRLEPTSICAGGIPGQDTCQVRILIAAFFSLNLNVHSKILEFQMNSILRNCRVMVVPR